MFADSASELRQVVRETSECFSHLSPMFRTELFSGAPDSFQCLQARTDTRLFSSVSDCFAGVLETSRFHRMRNGLKSVRNQVRTYSRSYRFQSAFNAIPFGASAVFIHRVRHRYQNFLGIYFGVRTRA